VYKILVSKSEWKRKLMSPKRNKEDNIQMDLKETGCECMNWIHFAQDRDTGGHL